MSDEKTTKRDWLLGAGALGAFLLLFFAGTHLWLLYSGPDAVSGFAVHGAQVVLLERKFGGEESIGGERLVVLDARTGGVQRRLRVDGRAFVGQAGDELWLRTPDGLEVRALPSLELVSDGAALAAKHPELKVLGDPERYACVDLPRGHLRFTSEDGRNLAFDLRARALSPNADTGCSAHTLNFAGGTLPDGRRLQTRTVPTTQRSELVLEGQPAEPLDVSGLELSLLADNGTQQALVVDGDVFVTRRTGTSADAKAELVRVSVTARKPVWASVLFEGRFNPDRLTLAGDVLLTGDGHRVFALDAKTGQVLWRREP